MDWWTSATFGNVTLTVAPSQHWSNRTMLDRDATLWGGCHVAHRDGATLYFAGDTGWAVGSGPSGYPMQDLATNELYVSCVSRKKRR